MGGMEMIVLLNLFAFCIALALFFYPLPLAVVRPLEYALVALLGLIFLVQMVMALRRRSTVTTHPESAKPVAAPPPSAPPPDDAGAVVQFLAQLQEKGRLVDFAMEDIAAYSNEQVAAAARVVHQGCREVLQAAFEIVPVHRGAEGEEITLAEDYDARRYRLVGKVPVRSPFRGTLLHRGWRTGRVSLPRVAAGDPAAREVIAPAEVEIQGEGK